MVRVARLLQAPESETWGVSSVKEGIFAVAIQAP